MNGTLALMIPIMALTIPFFVIWTKHRQKIAQIELDIVKERSRNAEQTTSASGHAQLEDRVRVLERIVTDSGFSLTQEIEALRLERDKVQ